MQQQQPMHPQAKRYGCVSPFSCNQPDDTLVALSNCLIIKNGKERILLRHFVYN